MRDPQRNARRDNEQLAHGDPWDDLIRRGALIPASSSFGLLDEAPVDYGFDASAELRRLRDAGR